MYRNFRLIGVFLFFLVNLYAFPSAGQSINSNDLSNVRVDELSDEQITMYMRQAEASGLSEAEMEQLAIQRGLPATEIEKLRRRMLTLDGTASSQGEIRRMENRTPERQLLDSGTTMPVVRDSLETDSVLPIFGASLFSGAPSLFEPDLRLATPQNYMIGPGDQLLIDIYGSSEEDHALTVTPEGTINIPYVGIVAVGGMTIEQATVRIRNQLETVYTAIRSGATKVSVALGNIRSITVILTGEVVRPGTYTLPSVATAFNALYHSGGPTPNGSFRNIQVIRNGTVIATLDIYDFLMNGSFEQNVRLQDQDVLMVSPYLTRVAVKGQVKRPALFELKEGETFDQLLAYAGGFTEDAYRARIKVTKRTDREQRIEDLLSAQFAHYLPQTGDEYVVDNILDRFENRVMIRGAVFRPGAYELSPGLTLSMLIKKAEGVKEDAFLNRGNIFRLKDDAQMERLSFNVAGILAGTETDIELKREDVVTISSIFDLREAYKVRIDGSVRFPGEFSYAEGMTLEDLIMQAGGFRENASGNRIEVSRRVSGADILSQSAQTAEVFQVDADKGLTKQVQDFELMPFDLVVVRAATGYETQRTVRIEGEVLYPGLYTIINKDERISDIIKRAGGFTPFAYIEGASLMRGGRTDTTKNPEGGLGGQAMKERNEQHRIMAMQQLQSATNTVDYTDINTSNDYVGINLERVIKRPGYRGDLILEDGDVIHVPKELQTIKISGEVLAPSTAVYAPTKGFKQYISQAGGFSSRALRKSAYVIYANGSVKSTNRFLFINNYPPIKPGAEIFVPQRPERERMGPQQWLGLSTGLASLAAVILTMIR